jgi:hypothetical protein
MNDGCVALRLSVYYLLYAQLFLNIIISLVFWLLVVFINNFEVFVYLN